MDEPEASATATVAFACLCGALLVVFIAWTVDALCARGYC